MRILFISSSSGSQGGGELYMLRLAQAYKQLGHEVGLAASDHSRMNSLADAFSSYGTVIRTPYTNTYDYRSRSLRHYFHSKNHFQSISETWFGFEPDIIHVNKQNLEDGLDLLMAAENCTTPSVATVHMTQSAAYLNAAQATIRDFVSKSILKRYSGTYIAIAPNRMRDLQSFLAPADATTVTIDNGVEIPDKACMREKRSQVRNRLQLDDGDPLIICVGRLNKQKRPERFFETAIATCKCSATARFIWVGDGELRQECEHSVAQEGLADRITVTGWIDDASGYMAGADLYFHTAAYEGLAFALLEAMAAGCPCMVYDDLLADLPFTDKDILTFEDHAHFVQTITDETISAYGQRCRAIIKESYSLEKMAREHLDTYQQAILESKGQ